MEPTVDVPNDLDQGEVRVLGCLIEKEATVPDSYPLTLASLRTACNQSTSRDPVVAYDDHTVERALSSLRERGLTRTVHSTSNRATKYRHVAADVLELGPAETAVLCVLLLRGAQTAGELKQRADRQHAFGSIDEVADVLATLAGGEHPLALQLERRPGQKDARWVHLLAGRPSVDPSPSAGAVPADDSAAESPGISAPAAPVATVSIDHIGIGVPDLDVARLWYDDLMAMVGFTRWFPADDDQVNYGPADGPGTQLFIYRSDGPSEYARRGVGLQHLAFRVPERSIVHAVHDWAVAQGAEIVHEPRRFPEYGEHCYATFVVDPHGFVLEIVCHTP